MTEGDSTRLPVERRRTVDGVGLTWWDWGGLAPSTEAVVFLHGLLTSGRDWDPVLTRIGDALRAGRRIAAPDMRGHGRSEKPRTGYGAEDGAREVVGLLDEIGATRAVLVGHSRGGWLSAAVATRFPDRVAGLVMVEWSPVVGQPLEQMRAHYDRAYERQQWFPSVEAAIVAARQPPYPDRWDEDRAVAFWNCRELRPNGSVATRVPLDVLSAIRDEYIASPDVRPGLRNVTVPALVVAAEPLGEVELARRLAVAELMPSSRVERLTGSHWLMHANPDGLSRVLLEFLGSFR